MIISAINDSSLPYESDNALSRQLLKIWLVALVVKLIIATTIPLSPDETYYWVWSQFLDWSYYDHPPMVSWLFALAHGAESLKSLVRWPFVILGHSSFLFFALAFKSFLPRKDVSLWLVCAMLSPLLGFGSMVATPDVPLLFSWSVAFYLFTRMLSQPTRLTYALFGAALGVGFCSKYMIVLFVLALLVLLFIDRSILKKIRWRWVPLTLVFGVLFSLPVIYWNATHEWISFKFQLGHGLGARAWHKHWTYNYVLEQIAIVFPIMFWLAFKKRFSQQDKVLWVFSSVPLIFFFFSSFKGRVEGNWPMMAYPTLYALAILNKKSARPILTTMFIWGTVALVALSDVYLGWLHLKPKDVKVYEYRYYAPIIHEVDLGQLDAPVYMGSYQMASLVSFHKQKIFPKLPGINRRDFYDDLNSVDSVPDEFYVYTLEQAFILPQSYTDLGFKIVEHRKLSEPFSLIHVKR